MVISVIKRFPCPVTFIAWTIFLVTSGVIYGAIVNVQSRKHRKQLGGKLGDEAMSALRSALPLVQYVYL